MDNESKKINGIVVALVGGRARLMHPMHIVCGDGNRYHVPSGFETDFASVPRAFWWLLPPWGRHAPAAVVHDYLYQHGLGWSRAEADDVFLYLMCGLGVEKWKRYMMYYAVRMFGWMAWHESNDK